MLILLGIFLSAAHNAQHHLQVRTHGSCVEVLSFDPNREGLSVQSLNQVGRCDVYSICSVWFKDLKLVRIWGRELSNVLNFQNADPPPRFPPRKEERAGQEPQRPGELLWWGYFWPVAGDSSARLVREAEELGDLLSFFPAVAWEKQFLPLLLQISGPGEPTCKVQAATWNPCTHEGLRTQVACADPQIALLISATSDPHAVALQS